MLLRRYSLGIIILSLTMAQLCPATNQVGGDQDFTELGESNEDGGGDSSSESKKSSADEASQGKEGSSFSKDSIGEMNDVAKAHNGQDGSARSKAAGEAVKTAFENIQQSKEKLIQAIEQKGGLKPGEGAKLSEIFAKQVDTSIGLEKEALEKNSQASPSQSRAADIAVPEMEGLSPDDLMATEEQLAIPQIGYFELIEVDGKSYEVFHPESKESTNASPSDATFAEGGADSPSRGAGVSPTHLVFSEEQADKKQTPTSSEQAVDEYSEQGLVGEARNMAGLGKTSKGEDIDLAAAIEKLKKRPSAKRALKDFKSYSDFVNAMSGKKQHLRLVSQKGSASKVQKKLPHSMQRGLASEPGIKVAGLSAIDYPEGSFPSYVSQARRMLSSKKAIPAYLLLLSALGGAFWIRSRKQFL